MPSAFSIRNPAIVMSLRLALLLLDHLGASKSCIQLLQGLKVLHLRLILLLILTQVKPSLLHLALPAAFAGQRHGNAARRASVHPAPVSKVGWL